MSDRDSDEEVGLKSNPKSSKSTKKIAKANEVISNLIKKKESSKLFQRDSSTFKTPVSPKQEEKKLLIKSEHVSQPSSSELIETISLTTLDAAKQLDSLKSGVNDLKKIIQNNKTNKIADIKYVDPFSITGKKQKDEEKFIGRRKSDDFKPTRIALIPPDNKPVTHVEFTDSVVKNVDLPEKVSSIPIVEDARLSYSSEFAERFTTKKEIEKPMFSPNFPGRKLFLPQESEQMVAQRIFSASEKEQKNSDQIHSGRTSIDSREDVEVLWKSSEKFSDEEDSRKSSPRISRKNSLTVPLWPSDGSKHFRAREATGFTSSESANSQFGLQAALPGKFDSTIEKYHPLLIEKKFNNKHKFDGPVPPNPTAPKHFLPLKDVHTTWSKQFMHRHSGLAGTEQKPFDLRNSWRRNSSVLSTRDSLLSGASSRTSQFSTLTDSSFSLHRTESIRTETASIMTAGEHINSRIAKDRFLMLKRLATFVGEEQFINDDDHRKFISSAKHRAAIEIPEPITAAIKLEIFPILLDTLKQYRLDLGRHHPLTVELERRVKQMKREISSFIVKDIP